MPGAAMEDFHGLEKLSGKMRQKRFGNPLHFRYNIIITISFNDIDR